MGQSTGTPCCLTTNTISQDSWRTHRTHKPLGFLSKGHPQERDVWKNVCISSTFKNLTRLTPLDMKQPASIKNHLDNLHGSSFSRAASVRWNSRPSKAIHVFRTSTRPGAAARRGVDQSARPVGRVGSQVKLPFLVPTFCLDVAQENKTTPQALISSFPLTGGCGWYPYGAIAVLYSDKPLLRMSPTCAKRLQ